MNHYKVTDEEIVDVLKRWHIPTSALKILEFLTIKHCGKNFTVESYRFACRNDIHIRQRLWALVDTPTGIVFTIDGFKYDKTKVRKVS